MAIRTHAELRSSIGKLIRDTTTDGATFITDCLNLTLLEIHNYYTWSWLKRKTTFATVASQEDYRLDEEVDRVAFLRQRSSPIKLTYVPDRLFYTLIPNPEDATTGSPFYYRLWEDTGFTASLAADDTIEVLSSSTSDGSSFKVRVVGRNTDGIVIAETLTLNGTTAVTSTNTFDSGSLLRVSKSANTTGVISVRRTTGSTVLIRIAPTEVNPRSKILSLYPIPSSAITMYLEYFERPFLLSDDHDVPQLDPKWMPVLREGTLAKLWPYKDAETKALAAQNFYEAALKRMRKEDEQLSDYVPVLQPWRPMNPSSIIRLGDSVSGNLPSYAFIPY